MDRKLILPAEVKVCATCSYWDGERTVDPELRVVVVAESCEGMCLVQEKCCCSLHDVRNHPEPCSWEHLAPDQPEEAADGGSSSINSADRADESADLQTGT